MARVLALMLCGITSPERDNGSSSNFYWGLTILSGSRRFPESPQEICEALAREGTELQPQPLFVLFFETWSYDTVHASPELAILLPQAPEQRLPPQ